MNTGRFRALKHGNYRVFALGQLVSMSGSWVQTLALNWLIYRTMHSSFWVGALSFARLFTPVLVNPVIGVWLDRFDRKRMLLAILCLSMVHALTFAFVAFQGIFSMLLFFVLAVIGGMINGAEVTARQTFVVDMVGKEDMPSAVSLNLAILNISRVLGPGAAALFIAHVSEAWCFLVNGLSYVPIIVGIALMRVSSSGAQGAKVPVATQLKQAFEYMMRTVEVRNLIAATFLVSSSGFAVSVLLPSFVKEVLAGDADRLSKLTASFGAGGVLGLLFLGAAHDDRNVGKKVGAGLLCMSLAYVFLGMSAHYWHAIVSCVAIGFFLPAIFSYINSRIQHAVSDGMRGRIMSLYMTTYLGSVPLGHLLFGSLSDLIGPSRTSVVAGIWCLILGFGIQYLKLA